MVVPLSSSCLVASVSWWAVCPAAGLRNHGRRAPGEGPWTSRLSRPAIMGPVTDPTKYVGDIAELAREHGFLVGAAESLTGGAVSSALAMGSGAADWYHGCVVAYSRTVKREVLGVTA